MDKYARKIQDGSIHPLVDVERLDSGTIFDPADPMVPLEVAGFGIYKFKHPESVKVQTGEREAVLLPMEGRFTLKTEAGEFELDRTGGPFAVEIGQSNASAAYIPRDSWYELSGRGEVIYYTAPSSRKMRPVLIGRGEKPNLSRGDLFWRRDVITLVEPGVSTNLIVGETYSPPGLWSGTPLHVHDIGDPARGESEHEEVYYHVCRMSGREVPNYAVQFLFDGRTLNRCYLCPDKTAVAIPGGCHPVVASPVSDCLYAWGLAGVEGFLGMRDLGDFAYMKKIGDFLRRLRAENGDLARFTVEREKLAAFAEANALDEFQAKMVRLILHEYGVDFE